MEDTDDRGRALAAGELPVAGRGQRRNRRGFRPGPIGRKTPAGLAFREPDRVCAGSFRRGYPRRAPRRGLARRRPRRLQEPPVPVRGLRRRCPRDPERLQAPGSFPRDSGGGTRLRGGSPGYNGNTSLQRIRNQGSRPPLGREGSGLGPSPGRFDRDGRFLRQAEPAVLFQAGPGNSRPPPFGTPLHTGGRAVRSPPPGRPLPDDGYPGARPGPGPGTPSGAWSRNRFQIQRLGRPQEPGHSCGGSGPGLRYHFPQGQGPDSYP